MAENSERETKPGYNEESKNAGQPLSDFLLQLEDYTPTVLIYTFPMQIITFIFI